MQIKSIMRPVNKLVLLSPEDTARQAIEKIEKGDFLSLPVVEDRKFLGFLSKQFIYDRFFAENKSGKADMDAFMLRRVSDFLFSSRLEPLTLTMPIEEAALRFSRNKLRFLPVQDERGDFAGIVTQQALFEILVKAFGVEDPKLIIVTDGIGGVLNRAAEVIAKNGGNITNVIQLDTDVPNVQEISIRLTGADIDDIKKKLEDKGFRVR